MRKMRGHDGARARAVCKILRRDQRKAKIDGFIRTKGVTRCPTACAAETQGSPDPVDRAALVKYAELREAQRRRALARSRGRAIAALGLPSPSED
jgi:hypothetical protein